MAWSAPRTWVSGEIVTASLLNTEMRDNLLELSAHAHGGGAGDGDDELSGVDSINMDEIGTPSAPGASKTILYTKTSSGLLFYRAGAAGAEIEISDSSHTHSLTEFDDGQDTQHGSVASPAVGQNIANGGGTSTALVSVNSLSEATLICAVGVFGLEVVGGSGWTIELLIDGDVVASQSGITAADDLYVLTGSQEESSGTPSVVARATNNGSGSAEAFTAVGFVAVQL